MKCCSNCMNLGTIRSNLPSKSLSIYNIMNNGILLLILFFPVPNPLIPFPRTRTLTRKFRLFIRIQSTRLSSLHSPAVCYMGQRVG